MAREPIIDDRIFLQGNKLFFLEPLESTATEAYLDWTKETYSAIINGTTPNIKKYIRRVQNLFYGTISLDLSMTHPSGTMQRQFSFY